jgi:hypothetical protein
VVIAEAEPRCTVCGVPVRKVNGMLLHYDQGKLDLMRRNPFPHGATLEPQTH